MSRIKEYYMKINHPNFGDIEREYLINDSLSQEEEYLEYEKFKREYKEENRNSSNSQTKIEIGDVREINKEEPSYYQEIAAAFS